jgi:hypothetical protein
VPEYNSDFCQFLRKGKWLVIGLLAPEVVLFMAWYQYVRARETAKMVSAKLMRVPLRGEAVLVKEGNEGDKAENLSTQATLDEIGAAKQQTGVCFLSPTQ